MRIVFIGAVEFSLQALSHLTSLGANIVGVCTLKDSKFNSDHVDLTNHCQLHAIPSFYVDNINSAKTIEWIANKNPDIIFCFGWSRLIKRELLSLAPLGVVGHHPAALPNNRGRHPIIWALVLGLETTASTFFFMNEGADSGGMLSQVEIKIAADDDARTLYDKIVRATMNQISSFFPQLKQGNFSRTSQNELLANVWRKRGYLDGEIDWRMSAQSINNLVRGLTLPYSGAHFILDKGNQSMENRRCFRCSE